MKHGTYELYHIHPSELRELPYEEALLRKADGAKFSMRIYADRAGREPNKFAGNYEVWRKKFKASEDALEHNRKLLEELKETERKNNVKSKTTKRNTLCSERIRSLSKELQGGPCRILIDTWCWFKTNLRFKRIEDDQTNRKMSGVRRKR